MCRNETLSCVQSTRSSEAEWVQRLRRSAPDRRIRIVLETSEGCHGAFVADFAERGSRKLAMAPLGIAEHSDQSLNALPILQPPKTANRP